MCGKSALTQVRQDLSQLSHGLTGRYGIMASILDTGQVVDQRILNS